ALLIGLVLAWRRRHAGTGFLVIPVLIYVAYAVTGNLNIGHRHILPIFPFLYILCGAAGVRWTELRRRRALTGVVAVAWLAAGSVVVLLPRPASVINQHLA